MDVLGRRFNFIKFKNVKRVLLMDVFGLLKKDNNEVYLRGDKRYTRYEKYGRVLYGL